MFPLGSTATYNARQQLKITLTSLFKHSEGRRGVKSKSYGPPNVLPIQAKDELVKRLRTMENMDLTYTEGKFSQLLVKNCIPPKVCVVYT